MASLNLTLWGLPAGQVLCGDEYVKFSDAHLPVDLWQADPWDLISLVSLAAALAGACCTAACACG